MTIRACGRGPTRLREPDRNSRAGGLLGSARRLRLAVLSRRNGMSPAQGEILEKTLAMEPFRRSTVAVQAPKTRRLEQLRAPRSVRSGGMGVQPAPIGSTLSLCL